MVLTVSIVVVSRVKNLRVRKSCEKKHPKSKTENKNSTNDISIYVFET